MGGRDCSLASRRRLICMGLRKEVPDAPLLGARMHAVPFHQESVMGIILRQTSKSCRPLVSRSLQRS